MTTLTSHPVLSFDVYGTLIDWETGIYSNLLPILSLSPQTPCSSCLSYPRGGIPIPSSRSPVLALTHQDPSRTRIRELNLDPPTAKMSRTFGKSVGSWPAFPDTLSALKRLQEHFKLVVLSNTDRDSFAATNAAQMPGITFDAVFTAQDIGSYKPGMRNFEYMLGYVEEKWGTRRDEVLQRAQSQFHGHYPAREKGIRSVWIVRPGAVMGEQGEKGEEVFDWKFDTLGQMADAVEMEVSG